LLARGKTEQSFSGLGRGHSRVFVVFIFVIRYCYRQYVNLFSIPALYTVRKNAVQEKEQEEEAEGTCPQERKKKSQARTTRTDRLRGSGKDRKINSCE